MSMLQRFFPVKWALKLFISGLIILLLVPALLFVHPGNLVKASGGGGGCNSSPSTSLYPTIASPGTTITVSGDCYPTNTTVKVFFQTPSNGVVTVVTDPQFGSFLTQLTIPSTYVQGTRYYVHVNSTTFSVKMLFTFTRPSLSLFGSGYDGGSLTFGSLVLVNGSGFAVNETVDLVWNDSVSGMMKAGIAGTDSSGNLNTSLNMPSFPFGSQLQLVATGRISGVTASALAHETPAIIPNPASGTIGITVTLNGGSFGGNEGVKILFQGTLMAHAYTNAKGFFTTSFIVPSTAKIGFGYNDILASGKTSGVAANATFSVKPNLSISPNTGPSGTLITVKGGHFTPSGSVEILWVFSNGGGSGGSGGNTLFLTRAQASAHGTFTVTVSAPGGLIPGQIYYVQAIDDQTGGSNQVKFHAQ